MVDFLDELLFVTVICMMMGSYVSLTTKVAKKFHTLMKESFDFVRHSLDVMNIPIYSLAE